jgi:hypothetical protein
MCEVEVVHAWTWVCGCVFATLLCVGLGQFENKIASVGSLRQQGKVRNVAHESQRQGKVMRWIRCSSRR